MKETILITGATGTVGSETVQVLSGADVKVRAGVHSLIKGDRFKALPNVELVALDFHNPETIVAAFTGVTRVFLITPFSEEQVQVSKTLIDAARQAGVKHLVRLSASGADAHPGIQLGRWHREVEEYVEKSGLAYTILRPTSFMQNFINHAGDGIRNHDKIYMPSGTGKISYVDVRDIAAVASVVLTTSGHEGKIYEITGPQAVTVNDVAHALTVGTDRVITYVDVPEETAANAMTQMHMPAWMVNALMELQVACKNGAFDYVFDTVEIITGRKPRTITDFAADYVDNFIPA